MSGEGEAKIGLEVHCQLTSLKTKLFCGCSADYRDCPPNTLVCPVCLGLPGSLPVLNRKALEFALMVGLALRCTIPGESLFFRKNYYYPDLPKNFQISQYDRAGGVTIAYGGQVNFTVNKQPKNVAIRRIQLEEDPGKLYYVGDIETSPYAMVDYNRSGVALLEIVTEPEFRSPQEARIFLQKLRSILEHLGVSDGRLEGSMRCDANISTAEGARVEVKNITSFKEVERALSFEIIRQRNLLKRSGEVKSETRHWDDARGVTVALRSKEEEQDYRYFPEPDLVPLRISKDMIEAVAARMPELPDARRERFMSSYGLPEYDAELLTSERRLADFFEACVRLYGKPKPVANWLMGDVLQCLHSLGVEIDQCKMRPEHLAEMLKLLEGGVLSVKLAKKVLWEIMKTGKMPQVIVEERGWLRITDERALAGMVEKVFADNPKAVGDALREEKAVNFLVGQLMALTRGRADPALANRLIREKLRSLKGG